jgi:hypothetical protein
MTKPKILLIIPQFRIARQSVSIYSKNALRRAQPLLGMVSIASSLFEAGYEVKYLDSVIEGIEQTFPFDEETDCYGLTYAQILDRVRDFSPDIVGISCLFVSQMPHQKMEPNNSDYYRRELSKFKWRGGYAESLL